MKIKPVILVFAGCAAILIVLYYFSLEKPLSTEIVSEAVASFTVMEKVLHADKVDYEKVDTLYRKGIWKILHEVDEAEERKFHFNVEDSIERSKEGKIPKIAVHVVEKPIQHAFYRYMIIELSRLLSGKETKEDLLEKAQLCFSVLQPVIKQADQLTGANGLLFERGQALFSVFSKDDLNEIQKKQTISQFETLYKGVSLIMVLAAIDGVEDWQQKDKMEALVHMADAKMNYTILYEDHALAYRKDAVMVLGEFNKAPKKVDTKMIRTYLQKAFATLIPELPAEKFERKPLLEPSPEEVPDKENQA